MSRVATSSLLAGSAVARGTEVACRVRSVCWSGWVGWGTGCRATGLDTTDGRRVDSAATRKGALCWGGKWSATEGNCRLVGLRGIFSAMYLESEFARAAVGESSGLARLSR